MGSKRRILIVDDSSAYRHQLRLAIEAMADMEVVGEAANGVSAVQFAKYNQVDAITLDFEMPEMNGLQTVQEIRKFNQSSKIFMISSITKIGAESTMSALRAGADDFVTKPDARLFPKGSTPAQMLRSVLEPKMLAILTSPSTVLRSVTAANSKFNFAFFKPAVIVIGASTGGPMALENLFSKIKSPLMCPVVITQHMPPVFTTMLAKRLGAVACMPVREAADGDELTRGHILLAPGDFHLRIKSSLEGKPVVRLDQGPTRNSVRPAVDHLFESAVQLYGARSFGVVLTGMGSDGKEGSQKIQQSGGPIAIQNQRSCVVFGMPGAIFETGGYDFMGDLTEIAALLTNVAGV